MLATEFGGKECRGSCRFGRPHLVRLLKHLRDAKVDNFQHIVLAEQ